MNKHLEYQIDFQGTYKATSISKVHFQIPSYSFKILKSSIESTFLNLKNPKV